MNTKTLGEFIGTVEFCIDQLTKSRELLSKGDLIKAATLLKATSISILITADILHELVRDS